MPFSNNVIIEEGLNSSQITYDQLLTKVDAEDMAVLQLSNILLKNLWQCGDEQERYGYLVKQDVLTSVPSVPKDLYQEYVAYVEEGYANVTYLGLVRLIKSYCVRDRSGIIQELPHEVFWRVICHLLPNATDEYKLEVFRFMWSMKAFTMATPMLMQAMTKMKNNASCFLLTMEEDSIEGIYNTFKEMALIAKSAGGIGLDVSNIRGKGSLIRGTNGRSGGLIPWLRQLNEQAKAVDQGGGKRKGSISVYLEPWHIDFPDFIHISSERVSEELRCPELFTAVYTNDVFMEAVDNDDDWYLFCPNDAPLLLETYGENFKAAYRGYIESKRYRKVVKARELMTSLLGVMLETGRPYMVNKDAVNENTVEANYYGIIRSSNLCAEITESTNKDYTAVCTLGSVALPVWSTLMEHERGFVGDAMVRMLNNSITNNHAVKKTHDHVNRRPIGVGWQGVHDYFIEQEMPWGDGEALERMGLFQEELQQVLLNASQAFSKETGVVSSIFRLGCPDVPRANSMLTACMPTKSTSHILGWSEGIDPYVGLIYKQSFGQRTLLRIPEPVKFVLMKYNLYNEEVLKNILENQGSARGLVGVLPEQTLKALQTAFEIGNKAIIDMAAVRQKNVDQSQSMNLFLDEPSVSKLYSAIMYGWKKRLKTLSYYTHVRMSTYGNNFVYGTVDKPESPAVCSIDDDSCESCSG